MRIRWKIFVSMFFVSIVILLILWSCQVLLMNSFYQSVKTEELKNATNEVIENIESANSQEIFDRITMLGDINIRIINISNFEDVYTGGDGLISATHDIGDFEILRLYNLALQNNGEVSCYYTYDREKQYFHQLPPDSKDSDKNQDTDFSNYETNLLAYISACL